MSKYHGGQTAKSGFYWNTRTWAITMIERQGGVLPGDGHDRYTRIPVVAMLLVAPFMGAAYVLFLPFIGIAMVVDFVARRVGRGVKAGALAMTAAVSPQWRPGEAYLAKDDKDEDEKAETKADEKKDDKSESRRNAE